MEQGPGRGPGVRLGCPLVGPVFSEWSWMGVLILLLLTLEWEWGAGPRSSCWLCAYFLSHPSMSGTVTGSGMRGEHPDTAPRPAGQKDMQATERCLPCAVPRLPCRRGFVFSSTWAHLSECLRALPGRGPGHRAVLCLAPCEPQRPRSVSTDHTVCTGSLDRGSHAHRLGKGPSRRPSSQTPSRSPLSLRGLVAAVLTPPQ